MDPEIRDVDDEANANGEPTPADRRFWDLQDAGHTGWINEDAHPITQQQAAEDAAAGRVTIVMARGRVLWGGIRQPRTGPPPTKAPRDAQGR